MKKSWQVRMRMATHLHDRLQQLQNTTLSPLLDQTTWNRFQRFQQQYAIADQRGWRAARNVILSRIHTTLDDLRTQAGKQQFLITEQRRQSLASIVELARDLEALEMEFPCVELNLQQQVLSVETEYITLEGIELGPFRIILTAESLGRASPYRIEAISPNPASSNSETTHPHVMSQQLCEGEGRGAIREALHSGRLLDLFLLIRQILTTYNPSSAYVSLNDWSGVSCQDCGSLVNDEDRRDCEGCREPICWDCISPCADCDGISCAGCLTDCSDCGNSYCAGCVTRCEDCHELFCQECLEHEDRCRSCQEAAEIEAEELEQSQTLEEEQESEQEHVEAEEHVPELDPA